MAALADQPQADQLRQFRALAAQTLHLDHAPPVDKACRDRLFRVPWPKISPACAESGLRQR